jgi:hypothetical protein
VRQRQPAPAGALARYAARSALAYPERATATAGDLLWFSHGADRRGGFVTACLTGNGATAVLAGEHPALLRRGGPRTPAATGLANALDCTAGRTAIALRRALDPRRGPPHRRPRPRRAGRRPVDAGGADRGRRRGAPTRHNIYSYDWVIHGQANSTQNDVAVTLSRDRTGPDETLHGFASGREKNGYGVTAVSLSYPTSYKLYGSFSFVFDVNNVEPDPRCSGETTRF